LAPCTGCIFGASSAVVELINLNFSFCAKIKSKRINPRQGKLGEARHDDTKSRLHAASVFVIFSEGFFCCFRAIRILLAGHIPDEYLMYAKL